MTTLHTPSATAAWTTRILMLLCAATLGACSVLKPGSTEPPAFYALESAPASAPVRAPDSAARTLPTLIITPPRAAAGYDSQRIIFVRNAHQLEYFAHSEWVDTPTRMLGPLLVSAMEGTGAFGAVVMTPASASGDLRLETEILRLQHNFQVSPSRVEFTLRALVLDDKTRRVLAWHEFHAEAVAASDSPQGGIAAANQAAHALLNELAQFVANTKTLPR